MSYLDDADHAWELDPAVAQEGDDWTLQEMLYDIIVPRNETEEGIRIILEGYAGLKARLPEASNEDCLRTSMIWYYG
jgi:hypothetical protein